MTTFVLVHGSWHDGAAWGAVAGELVKAGHTVHTPTLAGHGKGADKAVDHDACVRSVVDHLTAHDLDEVVLLGHSFGGSVIARVAEEVPGRLERLIFWNAFVPERGNCLLDEVPPDLRAVFRELAAASPDNSITMPFGLWWESFIQDADHDLAASAYASLSPEPFQPLIDRFDLRRFYGLTIPKSYLNATEDLVLRGEWAWHPRMSNRLGIYRLVEMPGSHEVIFTNPGLLAAKILEAAHDSVVV
ncbi:alpha/beta fold hydrolase [Nonomuraea jiangxiensis]|uniref:Pimeloyl-ACP methyl ester carboxylesterase n=1 Tax=Nonomuraea jiangxiensis TaxID=633440 RepID=A0A1G9B5J8_9ACTN|nr:alpha/beta hydrolase [Nonomuraea jiangxiensis]SDK34801.1 Pimeloyl-ACP methyl ester carboxylesterase [Nonomuraea jiangxiensis]